MTSPDQTAGYKYGRTYMFAVFFRLYSTLVECPCVATGNKKFTTQCMEGGKNGIDLSNMLRLHHIVVQQNSTIYGIKYYQSIHTAKGSIFFQTSTLSC